MFRVIPILKCNSIKLSCALFFSAGTNVWGIPTVKVIARVNIPLWNPNGTCVCLIFYLPEFLDGTTLFQAPYKNISAGTTIGVETTKPSTIYIAVRNDDVSNPNTTNPNTTNLNTISRSSSFFSLSSTLNLEGWIEVDDSVKCNGTQCLEELNPIWKKTVITPQFVNLTFSEDELTPAIFVDEREHFFKF